MSNIKSGINIFDNTSITIGNGSAVDGYIYIDNGDPAPYLRHNTSGWVFSNDGSTETSIGTGFTSYTIGDILYANSTTSLSKLPISDDGYVLTLSGGIPSWQNATGGTTDHNALTNLQGGESDGYYHLTPDQHTWLTDGYSDGYWNEVKGGTGQTSYTTGDILYADGYNSLTTLDIGSANQILKISGGVPTWQDLSGTLVEISTENVGGGTGALANINPLNGNYNTAFGYNAGNSLTTGDNNVLIGRDSGNILSIGFRNIIISGGNDVATNYTGDDGIIIGGIGTARLLPGGDYNVVIGSYSGYNLVGNSYKNTLIGANCGYKLGNANYENTSVGYGAFGDGGAGLSNVAQNVSIGVSSFKSITAAVLRSVAIGYQAGINVAGGQDLVAIGSYSGLNGLGSRSIGIGSYSGGSTATDAISIGYFSKVLANKAIALGTYSEANEAGSLVISGYGTSGSKVGSQGINTATLGYHSLYLGQEADVDIYLFAHNGDANKPYIKYNSTGNVWQFSNNGVDGYDFGTGSGGVSTHNDLNGLQGGEVDGYYHLTPDEHTWLTDSYTTGYWIEVKGGTGQTTYTTGDLLYASASNTLSKLTATTDGYILSLSSGVPVWGASSILYNGSTPVITAQTSPSPYSNNSIVLDGYLLSDTDFSAPIFGVAPTSTHDGYTLTILGQNDHTDTYVGGDVVIQSGDGYSAGNLVIKAGDDNQGNLIINGDTSTDMQSAQGAIFIKNGDVVPTGNPTNGGYLFVENGALKYRGSSGTITTIAPA